MIQERIRNFSIIAHIDHGKSTLADRLLEATQALRDRDMKMQTLDDMDIERERGITIKSHAIRFDYHADDKKTYQLNLIDTPGHVDFTYEVSRSLSACEGALLVVDASQGIEAQTVSNLYLALENDLTIIPVLNKIDLPAARPEEVAAEIIDLLGCTREDIITCSAKQGIGIHDLLEAIIHEIPPPQGDPKAPLRAMIFDSIYDSYKGTACYVKVIDGTMARKDLILFLSNNKQFEVDEIGYRRLKYFPTGILQTGEVGYFFAAIKKVSDTKVGDTVTKVKEPTKDPLPGFVEIKPMVFAGLYPAIAEDYTQLRESLEKLKLNDASLNFTPETSAALGFGFRCGFLGLLHMEIITERLAREYDRHIINTVPNVEYHVITNAGKEITVDSPSQLPEAGEVERIEEPYVDCQIITPPDYIGNIMKLSTDRRGEYKNIEYLSTTRANISFSFPLAEIIFDFHDKLKSSTRGYASFDYSLPYYRLSNLVKLDVKVNDDAVDALSVIIHRERAFHYGRALCEKLQQLIPRQMFEVIIQAAIGNRIISRATVRALRKNVTAKCYGGDITRKRKLLERQKEGKKRMKQIGSVEIPQEAFLAALKIERT
ncbi:MAG: translation elongation factor 4 [candidate division Zixibacteria bacterium]|nr:translation elongation factor 4 [candidate division Zixibacteria bacterium]